MRTRMWLVSASIGFAIGAGGAWLIQADRQHAASTGRGATRRDGREGLPDIPRGSRSVEHRIKATSRSHFARDGQGRHVPGLRDGKKYYEVGEDTYSFVRAIDTGRTALIVMDPWEDCGSPAINECFGPVVEERLLPLVEKSLALGIPVIVLTNSPLGGIDYGAKIHPEIEKLAESKAVHVVHHQETDSVEFAEWLRGMSVDTLIYSGFASNMCVIGRDLGMIPMRLKGFRMFFVPEASAAVEFGGSWETGALHESTTLVISQWVGELIALRDFLSLPEAASN